MKFLDFDKIYIINLEHRTDRWENMQEQFAKHNISMANVIKWKAINGKNLSTEQKKQLTTKWCYYFCNNGVIGCFLSHFGIWKDIVKNRHNKVLILEDDIQFDENVNQINNLIKSLPEDWDINFVGSYGSSIDSNLCKFTNGSNKIISTNIIDPCWITGSHAYMLNYNSAVKLLHILPKVYYHVDYSMFVLGKENDLKIYAQYPPIIKQKDSNDSDIQVTTQNLLSYFFNGKYILGFEYGAFLNSSLISIGKFNISLLILLILLTGILSGFFKLPIVLFIVGLLVFDLSKLEYIIILLASYCITSYLVRKKIL